MIEEDILATSIWFYTTAESGRGYVARPHSFKRGLK